MLVTASGLKELTMYRNSFMRLNSTILFIKYKARFLPGFVLYDRKGYFPISLFNSLTWLFSFVI